ncbi:MAG: hypothetical protein ABF820_09970 [Sporolactobacillus sp.]
MDSALIIGCVNCEQKLATSKGHSLRLDGSCMLSFSTQVSYGSADLTNLFLNHFICPFCGQRLEITPKMMIYVKHFFRRPFHIDLHGDNAEIANNNFNFYVPYSAKIGSLVHYLGEQGIHLDNAENFLPQDSEIYQIQDISREFDPKQWTFRIESGLSREPYLSTNGLWFSGLDDCD